MIWLRKVEFEASTSQGTVRFNAKECCYINTWYYTYVFFCGIFRSSTELSVPKSLEEAPMRRQDRRTLNALRRRRADRSIRSRFVIADEEILGEWVQMWTNENLQCPQKRQVSNMYLLLYFHTLSNSGQTLGRLPCLLLSPASHPRGRGHHRGHLTQPQGGKPHHLLLVPSTPSSWLSLPWQAGPLGSTKFPRSPPQIAQNECPTKTDFIDHRVPSQIPFNLLSDGRQTFWTWFCKPGRIMLGPIVQCPPGTRAYAQGWISPDRECRRLVRWSSLVPLCWPLHLHCSAAPEKSLQGFLVGNEKSEEDHFWCDCIAMAGCWSRGRGSKIQACCPLKTCTKWSIG